MFDIKKFLHEECHGYALDDRDDVENFHNSLNEYFSDIFCDLERLSQGKYLSSPDLKSARSAAEFVLEIGKSLNQGLIILWAQAQINTIDSILWARKGGPME